MTFAQQEVGKWCAENNVTLNNKSEKRGAAKVFSVLYPLLVGAEADLKNKKISEARVRVEGVLSQLEGVRDALHSDK